jgi:hypothetical protein
MPIQAEFGSGLPDTGDVVMYRLQTILEAPIVNPF